MSINSRLERLERLNLPETEQLGVVVLQKGESLTEALNRLENPPSKFVVVPEKNLAQI